MRLGPIGAFDMKNAVIWGFGSKSAAHAVSILNEKKIIDIKAWIGNVPESTHDVTSFLTGQFKKDSYYGSPQKIHDETFQNTIHQYMDLMSRHSFYAEKSFYDHLNIFNLQFDWFLNLLTKNNVNIVLFSNMPHEGPDFLLYNIAKKLNIKTIMFYQTIFPNKFFYLFNIDDFGQFSEIEPLHNITNLKIEKKHEKNLFYMDGIKKQKHGIYSLQKGSLSSLVSSVFNKNIFQSAIRFLHRYFKHIAPETNTSVSSNNMSGLENRRKKLQNRVLLLNDMLSRYWSFLKRTLQQYSNHRESKKNISSILTKNINLKEQFVYFPLHLQPELTTSAIGGIYVDQLLAIENLSKHIPDNWYIYVKENPKQTELIRGKWFFERLRLIKNVKVVPPDFNTYLLMEKCVFVATITGTAGWEAISGGKNALVFGNPWYKSLPRVFHYGSDFKLEDILKYKINHDELETSLNLLLSKTCDGIIDEHYSNLVENFDSENNTKMIAHSIQRILN